MGYNIVVHTRSILHGYFNPLVFCYQWEYLLTSKEFIFFAGYIRLAMYNGQSWICLSVTIGIFPLYIYIRDMIYLISRGMKSMFSDDSARVGYI